MATVLPVSAHWPGIVDGSEAYAAQFGIGTADPMQTSSVSALESPGAPRPALYSAVGEVSAAYSALFHAGPPGTAGAKTREKLAGLSAARALSDGKTNVPSWFGVWFWTRPVPLNRAPSLGRCAPPPGSQESSSLSSRPTLSARCGSPALPPKASVATP